MKLIIKPIAPIPKPPEVVKVIPEKKPTYQVATKLKLPLKEEISEEDLERMAKEMADMQKQIKEKKGGESPSKKDTAWADMFKAWADKRGFKYAVSDISEYRLDLYKDENFSWRICIVRSYVTYNFGFYFNLFSGGYPKALEFSGIYKNKAIDSLNYLYNALSLFEDGE